MDTPPIHLKELMDWIEKTYGVRPKKILPSEIEISPDRVLFFWTKRRFANRIEIIFNSIKEELEFEEKSGIGIHGREDLVTQQYLVLVKRHQVVLSPHRTTFAYCSNIEEMAYENCTKNLPREKYEAFLQKYKRDFIWEIHQVGAGLTVFLFTKSDINSHKADPMWELMRKEYFELLREHGASHIIKQSTLSFDSKEKFESECGGDWSIYYR